MTAEEIYIKLKDELTADNESSSSPERIFIKSEGQTICTLGMNRSHEIIFVEFKPAPKDLASIENQAFVHPHPVEMLHDAGWRQAQLTNWEEAEKLLEIINRSYKKKKSRLSEEAPRPMKKVKQAVLEAIRAVERPRGKAAQEDVRRLRGKLPVTPPPSKRKGKTPAVAVATVAPKKPVKPAAKAQPSRKPEPKPKPKPKPKAKVKAKPKPKASPKKTKPTKKKKR
jgi:hypothetical protein